MTKSFLTTERQIYIIAALVAGPVIFVNYLRLYILLNAFLFFGRPPVFQDSFEQPRTVIYSWGIDEMILLYGHFLHLITIPLMFTLLYATRDHTLFRPLLLLALLLLGLEVSIRCLDSYGYIMYD